MVEKAMTAKGWSQRRLGAELGVLSDGRIFDSTQVRYIIQGRRRYYDTELVQKLIEVLGLPEDQAWHLAGVWPADLSVEGYRKYRQLVTAPAMKDSPERLRQRDTVVVALHERRQRRDRRRLWVLPDEVAA